MDKKTLYKELVEHPIMFMLQEADIDGYILTRMDVEIVEKLPNLAQDQVSTAALMYSGGRFKILLCADYLMPLTMNQRIAVLKHEVGHWVRKHLSRRNGRDPIMFNIAADMAINQDLLNLPPGLVVLPQNWPPRSSAEVYYDMIEKEAKKKDCNGGKGLKGFGQSNDILIDAGSETNEADSMAKDMLTDIVKERLAADKNNEGKLRGLYGGELSSLLDELLKPALVDWKQQVIQFPTSIVQEQRRFTLKRPDRRGLYPFGKRREYRPSIAVCVDTSGSVSNDMLETFFSQFPHLSLMLEEIWCIAADAVVQEAFLYKPGLEKRLRAAAKGRGGTDFDPAIEYINKNLSHLDGVIYLTDGYCPVPEIKCKLPVLWVVTQNKEFEGRPRVMAEDKGPTRSRSRW